MIFEELVFNKVVVDKGTFDERILWQAGAFGRAGGLKALGIVPNLKTPWEAEPWEG